MSLHEPAWQLCLELGSEVGFRARLSRTPKLAFLLGSALEGRGMPHHDGRVKAQACSGHSQLQTAEASHAPRPLGWLFLFSFCNVINLLLLLEVFAWVRACVRACVCVCVCVCMCHTMLHCLGMHWPPQCPSPLSTAGLGACNSGKRPTIHDLQHAACS